VKPGAYYNLNFSWATSLRRKNTINGYVCQVISGAINAKALVSETRASAESLPGNPAHEDSAGRIHYYITPSILKSQEDIPKERRSRVFHPYFRFSQLILTLFEKLFHCDFCFKNEFENVLSRFPCGQG
jgi:hypothetical protein